MAATARRVLGTNKLAGSSREHLLGTSQADTSHETSSSIINAEWQTWKEPRRNAYRLAACFLSFFVMGTIDGSSGALLPYFGEYYHVNHATVSLVYLSPAAGYIGASLSNHYLHIKLGQRGVAVMAGVCHMVAYAVMSAHPPFALLVVGYVFIGLGNGIIDSAWNAWASSLRNPSQVLGWLHAFYGAGGTLSPLMVTALITKANAAWYTFGYIMLAISGVEFVFMSWAFWDATASRYREEHSQDATNEPASGLYAAIFTAPSARVCWTAALFLLVYVGVEVALGAWIVTFMLEARHVERFASGMVAVGFWAGITVGRVILGWVTAKLGVKVSTTLYIVMAAAALVVFWTVSIFYLSAAAVAFIGFFLGPLFPSTVLVMNMLLPSRLHVTAIGFASAVGGCGSAVIPSLTGLLAQYTNGVKVLPIVVMVLLGILLVVWNCLPRIQKRTAD